MKTIIFSFIILAFSIGTTLSQNKVNSEMINLISNIKNKVDAGYSLNKSDSLLFASQLIYDNNIVPIRSNEEATLSSEIEYFDINKLLDKAEEISISNNNQIILLKIDDLRAQINITSYGVNSESVGIIVDDLIVTKYSIYPPYEYEPINTNINIKVTILEDYEDVSISVRNNSGEHVGALSYDIKNKTKKVTVECKDTKYNIIIENDTAETKKLTLFIESWED